MTVTAGSCSKLFASRFAMFVCSLAPHSEGSIQALVVPCPLSRSSPFSKYLAVSTSLVNHVPPCASAHSSHHETVSSWRDSVLISAAPRALHDA